MRERRRKRKVLFGRRRRGNDFICIRKSPSDDAECIYGPGSENLYTGAKLQRGSMFKGGRKRKSTGYSGGYSGKRHGKRNLLNIAAWTASFVMVASMIPAESPMAHKLDMIEKAVPAISLGVASEEKNHSEKEKNSEREKNDGEDEKRIPDSDIILTEINKETEKSDGGGNVKNADAMILKNDSVKTTKTSSVRGKGNIIIYHTHATESYLPAAQNSAHCIEEPATVREAGNNLAKALQAKGFSVVHDKTLHDTPSFNKSYNKSLETAKSLISKYGDLKLVMDLHRDAASSSGGKARTANIGGQTVASFSIVVGTKNKNYPQLKKFADEIIAKANEMYPGFGGRVIERPHRFNGYLSDRCVLLELGNNANTIEQVNTATIYLADVLANVLADN